MKKAKNRGGELRDEKVAAPLMLFVLSKFPRRVVECNILLLLFLYFLCVIFSLVLVLFFFKGWCWSCCSWCLWFWLEQFWSNGERGYGYRDCLVGFDLLFSSTIYPPGPDLFFLPSPIIFPLFVLYSLRPFTLLRLIEFALYPL
jgi:hypothetical protein